MNTFIVSDLHLGSTYFLREEFLRFLDALPPGTDLVLNGDTVDRRHPLLSSEHQAVEDRLAEESAHRRIVWVRGNHDETYRAARPGRIEFEPSFALGRRLFVAHGDDFDNVMPRHRPFILLFRFLHHLRIWLGAESVHVAHYAKRFPRLYRVLCRHVMLNAVQHAKENGFEAVTCGHTHYPEDRVVEGVRYLNTGSWTEKPVYYLSVTDTELKLVPFTPSEAAQPSPAAVEH